MSSISEQALHSWLMWMVILAWVALIALGVVTVSVARHYRRVISRQDATITVQNNLLGGMEQTIRRHRDTWVNLVTSAQVLGHNGDPRRLRLEVDANIWDSVHAAALLGGILADAEEDAEEDQPTPEPEN